MAPTKIDSTPAPLNLSTSSGSTSSPTSGWDDSHSRGTTDHTSHSSSSETDDDASGSVVDPDDDPYHPYNIDEPAKKWVSNGQFVYDAEQLEENM